MCVCVCVCVKISFEPKDPKTAIANKEEYQNLHIQGLILS